MTRKATKWPPSRARRMSKAIHNKKYTASLRAVMGPRIRAAREALGKTQAAIARRCGISAEFFARVERGHASEVAALRPALS